MKYESLRCRVLLPVLFLVLLYNVGAGEKYGENAGVGGHLTPGHYEFLVQGPGKIGEEEIAAYGRCLEHNLDRLEEEGYEELAWGIISSVLKIIFDDFDAEAHRNQTEGFQELGKALMARVVLKPEWLDDLSSVLMTSELSHFRFNYYGLWTSLNPGCYGPPDWADEKRIETYFDSHESLFSRPMEKLDCVPWPSHEVHGWCFGLSFFADFCKSLSNYSESKYAIVESDQEISWKETFPGRLMLAAVTNRVAVEWPREYDQHLSRLQELDSETQVALAAMLVNRSEAFSRCSFPVRKWAYRTHAEAWLSMPREVRGKTDSYFSRFGSVAALFLRAGMPSEAIAEISSAMQIESLQQPKSAGLFFGRVFARSVEEDVFDRALLWAQLPEEAFHSEVWKNAVWKEASDLRQEANGAIEDARIVEKEKRILEALCQFLIAVDELSSDKRRVRTLLAVFPAKDLRRLSFQFKAKAAARLEELGGVSHKWIVEYLLSDDFFLCSPDELLPHFEDPLESLFLIQQFYLRSLMPLSPEAEKEFLAIGVTRFLEHASQKIVIGFEWSESREWVLNAISEKRRSDEWSKEDAELMNAVLSGWEDILQSRAMADHFPMFKTRNFCDRLVAEAIKAKKFDLVASTLELPRLGGLSCKRQTLYQLIINRRFDLASMLLPLPARRASGPGRGYAMFHSFDFSGRFRPELVAFCETVDDPDLALELELGLALDSHSLLRLTTHNPTPDGEEATMLKDWLDSIEVRMGNHKFKNDENREKCEALLEIVDWNYGW